MSDIVDALRNGDGVWRDKRWTGDTFHDIGPIDEVALDALLDAAADEIKRLRAKLAVAATQRLALHARIEEVIGRRWEESVDDELEDAKARIEELEAKLAAIENILTLTEIACHDKVAVKSIRRILSPKARSALSDLFAADREDDDG